MEPWGTPEVTGRVVELSRSKYSYTLLAIREVGVELLDEVAAKSSHTQLLFESRVTDLVKSLWQVRVNSIYLTRADVVQDFQDVSNAWFTRNKSMLQFLDQVEQIVFDVKENRSKTFETIGSSEIGG